MGLGGTGRFRDESVLSDVQALLKFLQGSKIRVGVVNSRYCR